MSVKQYNYLVDAIYCDGVEVINERTGSKCKTLVNKVLTYEPNEFPIITERQINWKGAIKELLCYLRGYTNLQDFKNMGVNTWDANYANPNWQFNPNCQPDSLGEIYGASCKEGHTFKDIIENIKKNPYDRGHIYTFWNPDSFEKACLRPCQMMYQFNVLGDTLYTTVYSRSLDTMLGGAWNMIQAWFMNQIVAKLTGFKAGKVTHIIANAHIYENQYNGVREFLIRADKTSNEFEPEFMFKTNITLDDILENITKENFDEYFQLVNYRYLSPQIEFPLTA